MKKLIMFLMLILFSTSLISCSNLDEEGGQMDTGNSDISLLNNVWKEEYIDSKNTINK